MIGVLIVSHGNFAAGLLQAAEMIMGKQEQVRVAGLRPADNPDQFRDSLRQLIGELDAGDGVLILTDLYGGTPSNSAAYLFLEGLDIEIVSGVSLPVLLEVLTVRENQDLAAAADTCVAAAAQGVQKLSEVLRKE